jgi:hypothetical protein
VEDLNEIATSAPIVTTSQRALSVQYAERLGSA